MERLNDVVKQILDLQNKQKPVDLLEEFRDYQQIEELKKEYAQITGFYYKWKKKKKEKGSVECIGLVELAEIPAKAFNVENVF